MFFVRFVYLMKNTRIRYSGYFLSSLYIFFPNNFPVWWYTLCYTVCVQNQGIRISDLHQTKCSIALRYNRIAYKRFISVFNFNCILWLCWLTWSIIKYLCDDLNELESIICPLQMMWLTISGLSEWTKNRRSQLTLSQINFILFVVRISSIFFDLLSNRSFDVIQSAWQNVFIKYKQMRLWTKINDFHSWIWCHFK